MKKYVKPEIEIVSVEAVTTILAASSESGVRSGSSVNYQYDEDAESLSKQHGGSFLWTDDDDE